MFWFLAPHRQQPPWPAWDISLALGVGSTVILKAYLPTFSYRVYAFDGPRDWLSEKPELRRLLTEVINTRDRERQKVLIGQMEQHTYEQAYFLFLYAQLQLHAINKEVTFTPHPGGLIDLVELTVTKQHWSVRK